MIGIIDVLSALGQRTRLEVLTLLSRGPSTGQTSGDLALQARVPANTMSTHLGILAAAGLVTSTRSGRSTVYRMERKAVDDTLSILSARLLDHIDVRYVRNASIAGVRSPLADAYCGSQDAVAGWSSATRAIPTMLVRDTNRPGRCSRVSGEHDRLARVFGT